MDPQQPPQPVQVRNPLNAMGRDEVNIFEVRRHPIGLLSIYFSFGILLLIIAVVVFIAPGILTDYDGGMVRLVGGMIFAVAAILSVIFLLVAHYVYTSNRWVLTSDSLTQVSQSSLFNRQNSQLSLGNLEDVTAQQDGIFAHMFNYGILKVETAGEHSKFSFNYCPDPNSYAQKILVARESFEQGERYNNTSSDNQTSGVNVNTQ